VARALLRAASAIVPTLGLLVVKLQRNAGPFCQQHKSFIMLENGLDIQVMRSGNAGKVILECS